MELRRAVTVLLVLLGALALAHASLWPDQHPMEELLAMRISGTLQAIFTNGFAGYNWSVFISTAYKQQMARDGVRLVQRILDHGLGNQQPPVPVVLASRLGGKLSCQVKLIQLLFVQGPEDVVAIASATKLNHLYVIVWLTTLPAHSGALDSFGLQKS